MNKKKNQTSIDLDAIMTEVLNLFTPEEQQEVIDILSNNGLEKIYQQMEETFYHYQHPDYSSEATPIAAYLQRQLVLPELVNDGNGGFILYEVAVGSEESRTLPHYFQDDI